MSLSTPVVLVAAIAAAVPDFATSTSASVARAGITNELALGLSLGLCLACTLWRPRASKKAATVASLTSSAVLVVFQLVSLAGQFSLPDWNYLSVHPLIGLVDRTLRVAVVGAAALFMCVRNRDDSPEDRTDTALACPIALSVVAGVCWYALSWCGLPSEPGFFALLSNTGLSLVTWALTALCYLLVALAIVRLGTLFEGLVILASFVGGALISNGLLRSADVLILCGTFFNVFDLGWRAVPLLVLVELLALALALLWARRHAQWHFDSVSSNGAGQDGEDTGSDGTLCSLAGYGALSLREREVLGLDLAGKKTTLIAEELGISRSSIATHRSRAYEKLGVASRQELLACLFDMRLQGEKNDGAVECPDAAGPARIFAVTALVRSAIIACVILLCAHTLPKWFISFVLLFGAATLYLFGLMRLGMGNEALDVQKSPREILGVVGLVGASVVLASPSDLGVICIAIAALVFSSLALGLTARSAFSHNDLALVAGGSAGLVAIPSVSPTTATQVLTLACLVVCSVLAVVLARRERSDEEAGLADFALVGQDRALSYLRGRGLTDLEAQVALLTASGFEVGGIAARLHVSAHTVSTYRARSYDKLGVADKSGLRDLLQREASLG